MLEPLPQDRLYPSLLDRLTDKEPSKDTEPPESRATSLQRLRETVVRDLKWLLNSTRLAANLEAYPEVQQSVINYGMPCLAGNVASAVRKEALKVELEKMLHTFEPRLIPPVRVQVESNDVMAHNVITFRIEATMWSQPIPLEIYMRTNIDLESGQTHVTEIKAD
jgi:type VI secretion system protein ImpF